MNNIHRLSGMGIRDLGITPILVLVPGVRREVAGILVPVPIPVLEGFGTGIGTGAATGKSPNNL
jgi:hypothetical protein